LGAVDFGRTQETFKASAVTPRPFAIDQQAESVLEGEVLAGGQLALFFEGARHAVKL